MTYCAEIEHCSFFNIYKKRRNDPNYSNFALNGIVNLYCNGMKQNQCKRKKLSQILGSEIVPENMSPLGRSIRGTDDSSWPSAVKKLILSLLA